MDIFNYETDKSNMKIFNPSLEKDVLENIFLIHNDLKGSNL